MLLERTTNPIRLGPKPLEKPKELQKSPKEPYVTKNDYKEPKNTIRKPIKPFMWHCRLGKPTFRAVLTSPAAKKSFDMILRMLIERK